MQECLKLEQRSYHSEPKSPQLRPTKPLTKTVHNNKISLMTSKTISKPIVPDYMTSLNNYLPTKAAQPLSNLQSSLNLGHYRAAKSP